MKYAYFGYALDLGWLVGIVGVDGEREGERSTLVHAYTAPDRITHGCNRVKYRHIPSSGVIVRVKLRRSLGLGKLVFIVSGSSSSVRSVMRIERRDISFDYRGH